LAPSIAAALRATACPWEVEHVGLRDVRSPQGPLNAIRGIGARRPAVAIVDAETDADLAAIARAVIELGSGALPVGSAGLAAQVARLTSPPRARSRPLPDPLLGGGGTT